MENHDHSHDEHHHDEIETTSVVENSPTVEIGNTLERHAHEHDGLDGLLEVMFGFEHVVAEIFWNSVWLAGAFAIGRLVAFRKVHKYIDDKHGVTHQEDEY